MSERCPARKSLAQEGVEQRERRPFSSFRLARNWRWQWSWCGSCARKWRCRWSWCWRLHFPSTTSRVPCNCSFVRQPPRFCPTATVYGYCPPSLSLRYCCWALLCSAETANAAFEMPCDEMPRFRGGKPTCRPTLRSRNFWVLRMEGGDVARRAGFPPRSTSAAASDSQAQDQVLYLRCAL